VFGVQVAVRVVIVGLLALGYVADRRIWPIPG
jgi:hypothetical protein